MIKNKVVRVGVLWLGLALSLTACGSDNTSTGPTGGTANPIGFALPTVAATTITAPSTTSAVATTAATTSAPTTTAATTSAASGQTQAQAIRSTDWNATFKADPKITFEQTALGLNLVLSGTDKISGIPQLKDIVYIDLDGDGVEEAAIPLFSGGTAGNIAFLVYKYAKPYPTLTDYQDGYKLYLKAENNRLVVGQPVYGSWEPNCCPGGEMYNSYLLKAGKLSQVSETSEGFSEAAPGVVTAFYNFLNDKKFQEAYNLLGASYQKANPYAQWQTGFASTEQVKATATLADKANKVVQVAITSVDKGAAGQKINKTFSGTWKLTWNTTSKAWEMSEPNIKDTTGGTTKGVILPVFEPLVSDLKSKTKVPIYLPSFLGEVSKNYTIYAQTVDAARDSYELSMGLTPDCNGNACYFGEIKGALINSGTVRNDGAAVGLANGITGYFLLYSCGASCGESTLSWWSQNKYQYILAIKAGDQTDMVKIANSMITNGPLN